MGQKKFGGCTGFLGDRGRGHAWRR
jgi:hypothetical protein